MKFFKKLCCNSNFQNVNLYLVTHLSSQLFECPQSLMSVVLQMPTITCHCRQGLPAGLCPTACPVHRSPWGTAVHLLWMRPHSFRGEVFLSVTMGNCWYIIIVMWRPEAIQADKGLPNTAKYFSVGACGNTFFGSGAFLGSFNSEFFLPRNGSSALTQALLASASAGWCRRVSHWGLWSSTGLVSTWPIRLA